MTVSHQRIYRSTSLAMAQGTTWCQWQTIETAEPGRIRAAHDSVMGRLTQIGTASAALTTTLQQGEQAYTTVFGG
ncbi:hypothetical protein ACIP3B_35870 [Streptomyces anulatus]|uniref:hypothetical protein n=1 Tax=Streptomyces anulatus TaxID=1892 RepID=UPI0033FDF829